MDSQIPKKRSNVNLIIIIVSVIIIAGLTAALVYLFNETKQKDAEMNEVVEQMNFEKEQVEKEYADLNQQFEVSSSNIHNDSLVQLLQDQKLKVQQLLTELRTTKSTNAKKIAQLKNELATVRKVMIQYVNQIDSLNTINKALTTENVEVHKKYRAASETVQQLSKEKDNLNQVVSKASILEITSFGMTALNSNNRKTGWFSQSATLQFNYTIGKNVTAQPGEKIVYLRITRPDNEVLTKSPNNVFPFENKNITYSAMKKFEFTGEAVKDVIYWKIAEILPKGKYNADFFVDGNRIGSFSFVFEK
jgi:hypothetical protein